ncbi:hypothetical protein ASPVEDRAFT_62226 [Aspergillus versicolor CBS 583.65]|uniref:Zn(2)-C6 fungal-type domain-containing protein n=1 Tax=Aspergillus versicolor CBS 583.65 TaxID=1036611 RepID=A0A1L9PKV8_ASPVE|nr:uncharacterized protein ASPVEDRAFT_62226 [Aspergillus versicolor CBS 583.65]OJJ02065.1 hypothetical protein ASPVEDRAFT_62226 [Aspergillus versicolor CBS 583.65]
MSLSIDQTGPRPRSGQNAAEDKPRKACINCRRQKMKCVVEGNNICRRCRRSGVPCIFLPRANAATLPESVMALQDDEFKADVLHRLEVIEERIGLSGAKSELQGADSAEADGTRELSPESEGLGSLWEAVAVLQRSVPQSVPSIWRGDIVKELWLSFHDRMPGLHFMPHKQTFSAPHPILLASILYCSSVRGPADVAELAPHYFTVLCNAIAQICIPNSEMGRTPDDTEEWAFQTVLGIILAGLLNEATVRETGIWISIAYRLILEHSPAHIDEPSRKWRKLFSGIQIIDLEHASLHLSCPVIPIEAPLPGLRTPHRDQLHRLTRMMHTGLTHFAGRGLPTIWSSFTTDVSAVSLTSGFTPVDTAVMRDWARQLDEWLVEFTQSAEGSEQDLKLVFRQYVLHRLVVLSIYHPVRGCNMWSNSITLKEQYELLLSARATLKLHSHDGSIWSNWDQVIITWAALIIIQGIEGGSGEPDDLPSIRVHLQMLKRMTGPKPSLRDVLVARLESSLTTIQVRESASLPQNVYGNLAMMAPMDQSWQLFDQSSLQQMYSDWMPQ